jgi:hypothetical protein
MTTMLADALYVGIPSVSWMIVRCRAAAVTLRITEKALRGCPAAQRASILRASAELASELSADRVTRNTISPGCGHSSLGITSAATPGLRNSHQDLTPVQREWLPRSSGVPPRDNPCGRVPSADAQNDGQMAVKQS